MDSAVVIDDVTGGPLTEALWWADHQARGASMALQARGASQDTNLAELVALDTDAAGDLVEALALLGLLEAGGMREPLPSPIVARANEGTEARTRAIAQAEQRLTRVREAWLQRLRRDNALGEDESPDGDRSSDDVGGYREISQRSGDTFSQNFSTRFSGYASRIKSLEATRLKARELGGDVRFVVDIEGHRITAEDAWSSGDAYLKKLEGLVDGTIVSVRNFAYKGEEDGGPEGRRMCEVIFRMSPDDHPAEFQLMVPWASRVSDYCAPLHISIRREMLDAGLNRSDLSQISTERIRKMCALSLTNWEAVQDWLREDLGKGDTSEERAILHERRAWAWEHILTPALEAGVVDAVEVFDRAYLPLRVARGARWDHQAGALVGGPSSWELEEELASRGRPGPVYMPFVPVNGRPATDSGGYLVKEPTHVIDEDAVLDAFATSFDLALWTVQATSDSLAPAAVEWREDDVKDFLSEIPSNVRVSDLSERYAEQWELGELLAEQEFEFATQHGEPPGSHEEAIDLVRTTVKRIMNGWRIRLTQDSSLQDAQSSLGEDFVAAIGMGLGTRLTALLTDYLRLPEDQRRSAPSQAIETENTSPASSKGATSVTFDCDVCGQRASTVSVVHAGHPSPVNFALDFLVDSTRVMYDYWGENESVLEEAEALHLEDVLRESDARRLFDTGKEVARFYCPYCDRSLCREHMTEREHLAHSQLLTP